MSPRFRKISGYVPLRSHPIRRMIGAAIRTAADDGAAAVYALPDKRVLRVATLAAPGATAARFPFWSRPIDPVPELPEGYEIVEGPTPADIDSVWARCRGDLVCTVRDARALAWKSLFAPLRVEGISRHGELVAVAASRAQGDRQWLVEDLLAVDDAALGAAVASVVRAAAQATAVQEIRKVGALVAPRLEPVLAACGFRADDFTFNLLVLPLDDGERGKKLEPAQWYLTPND